MNKDKIKIEVSVLTNPVKLDYENKDDLLEKIEFGDGIILKKGIYQATYLPSVWEQITEKEQFLSSLCMKAGLDKDAWRNEKLEIEVYKAIKCKK